MSAAQYYLGADLLPGSLLAGSALFAGASLQQVGLVETTAGKAGFITGLYVVLVPLAGGWLLLHESLDGRSLAGCCACSPAC